MSKSKPTAPTVAQRVEYVLKHGLQGVFSHSSEAVVRAHLAHRQAEDAKNGVDKRYAIYERTASYEPMTEDHPQHPDNPEKDPNTEPHRAVPGDTGLIPSGELSRMHPGTVKERKLA